MDLRWWLVLALLIASTANEKIDKVKICVAAQSKNKVSRMYKKCDSLSFLKKAPVECVFATDRLECLKMVSNREADFTVMEPEDVYLTTLWKDCSILVVSELRGLQQDPFKFGTVVVVRNNRNITGLNLRGRNFCHPGFKSGSKWNDLFAQYLEERLAPSDCDPGLSVLEDRFKTSSEFFGSACKAGPWSDDAEEDVQLKLKYMNLCSLCELGDCRNEEKYRGSIGSILCLTDGAGDVVWARYDDIKTSFEEFSQRNKFFSASDYSFLCENGTQKPVNDKNPCFWLAMPWQVIGANSKSVNDVQKLFSDTDSPKWKQLLSEVMESFMHYIVKLDSPKTPEDYLKLIPGYISAVEISQEKCTPKHSIKLCTTSPMEQKKCFWMSRVTTSLGLQPMLECEEKSNVFECLDSVSLNQNDIAVVDPDNYFSAVKDYGLETLFKEIPNSDAEGYVMSGLVSDDSGLNDWRDLKSKTACFTVPGGFGWNFAKQKTYDICSETGLLEYFAEVCVMRGVNGYTGRVCCSQSNSTGDVVEDGIRCLLQGGCDVFFTDSSHLLDSKGRNLKKICLDLGCTSISAYPHYLMIHPNVTVSKKDELDHFLRQISDLLGRRSKNDNRIMEIFGSFDGVSDVIFRDTSVSLSKSQSLDYYQKLIDKISCSGASTRTHLGILAVSFLNWYIFLS